MKTPLPSRVRPWLQAARVEIGALAAVAVVAGGVAAFIDIAEDLREGEGFPADEAVLRLVRVAGDPSEPVGPRWLEIAAADLTALGSIAVLATIAAVVIGFLISLRLFRGAGLLAFGLATGVALSQGLKMVFERARPEEAFRSVEAMNASFPSGHAMLSAVVYLTLGAILARTVRRKRLKAYALAVAVALTLIVGVTRIYLGVHWLTDVLAGWSVGAAWAMACWLAVWAWERRTGERASEPEPEPESG